MAASPPVPSVSPPNLSSPPFCVTQSSAALDGDHHQHDDDNDDDKRDVDDDDDLEEVDSEAERQDWEMYEQLMRQLKESTDRWTKQTELRAQQERKEEQKRLQARNARRLKRCWWKVEAPDLTGAEWEQLFGLPRPAFSALVKSVERKWEKRMNRERWMPIGCEEAVAMALFTNRLGLDSEHAAGTVAIHFGRSVKRTERVVERMVDVVDAVHGNMDEALEKTWEA